MRTTTAANELADWRDEIFAEAWAATALAPPDTPPAYLMVTALNACRDEVRREMRRRGFQRLGSGKWFCPHRIFNSHELATRRLEESESYRMPDPPSGLIDAETWDGVRRWHDSLPEDRRDIIDLVYGPELCSIREAAEEMGIPYSTAHYRHEAAIAVAKRRLTDER